MSTRSYIAQTLVDRKETENVKSDDLQYIYCHFDGYIKNGVGETLLKYYSEKEDINKIFEHGDISSLPEDPDNIREQAYKDRPAQIEHEYLSMRNLSGDIMIEYIYLFKDNKWHVSYLIMESDESEEEEISYFGYKSYHTKFFELEKEYIAEKELKDEEDTVDGREN